jgi:hypothetical protein
VGPRVKGCGVVWCGVVWCGVVWCGVVWYGACSSNCREVRRSGEEFTEGRIAMKDCTTKQ